MHFSFYQSHVFQGTVKKIAAGYENISKKPVKETGIPTFSVKHQTRDERLDMSKRERGSLLINELVKMSIY